MLSRFHADEKKSVFKVDVLLLPFNLFSDQKLPCMVIKSEVEDNFIFDHQFFLSRYWNHGSTIDGTPSWMVTCRWVRFPSPRWSVIYFLEPSTNLEAVAGRNCINTEKNGHTIWTIFSFPFISRTAKKLLPFPSYFNFFHFPSFLHALIVAQLSPHQYFHSGHFYLLCINCGTIIDAPCGYTGWYSI